jgi:hypothetical protein
MTAAERFVALEHLQVPTQVTDASHFFPHAKHVGDKGARAATKCNGKPKPAIRVEPLVLTVGDKHGASCVCQDRQDVHGYKEFRRHAPDFRL